MNVYSQARKELKVLATSLRGLLELDELLDEAGEFEKLASVAKGKKEQMEKEAEAAVAEVEKLKKKASDTVAKAKDQAQKIIDEAQKKAADIQAQSDLSLATAKKSFEELMAMQDGFLKEKEAQIKEATEAAASAQAVVDMRLQDIRTAEDRLSQVQAEIAKLKSIL